MPVINHQIENTLKIEMLGFIRLTVVLIVVVPALFFRRLSAVAAPMVAVLLAMLSNVTLTPVLLRWYAPRLLKHP